ncbi:hypothetical protein [Rhodococcus sp. 14-2496-1d]|uniref:hypothetical protein n=1 Tax=Rhodococcus sp. 14-2496-1d TaxID=2023146 RepID=UPI001179B577|nr:hypothetical protein [Rhodococcus sp. 14-2496-1d]
MHPNGTERPCRACGDARHARQQWDTRTAETARTARQARIDACEWCDDLGWRIEPSEVRDHDIPAIRCEHTPMALDEWQSLIPTEEPSHA